jgi:hypothetical protein
LPGRAHAVFARPGTPEVVAFARRAGRFAAVCRAGDGAVLHIIDSTPGRHFYGHGAFARDGRLLFAAENAYDEERGVIGVYDAEAGYARVGEYSSHGIGPHQMLLSADGSTIIVANGGMLTHPDTGRAKLNIPDMNPSLVYMDPNSGKLRQRFGFTESRLRKLSIRHIAETRGGTVAVGLQDQGPHGDLMPLVAIHEPGKDGLRFLDAPARIVGAMKAYCGSVALDASGRILAASAPRGGVIGFWDIETKAHLSSYGLPDGCGVAGTDRPETFILSSGAGGIVRYHVRSGEKRVLRPARADPYRWDNHITI